jgi:hypothetical protein
MRKILLSILAAITLIPALAQSELNAALGSGFSYFRDKNAPAAALKYDTRTGNISTVNPYGTQSGFYNSASLNLKRISVTHSIVGLEAAVEWLRCKSEITNVQNFGSLRIPASGKANLTTTFLTLSPFLGYRLSFKHIDIDFMAGLDLGYCLRLHETTEATDTSGKEYHTTGDKPAARGDSRIRLQVTVGIRRFGVFAGYSAGISPFFLQDAEGVSLGQSHVARFGVSYCFY